MTLEECGCRLHLRRAALEVKGEVALSEQREAFLKGRCGLRVAQVVRVVLFARHVRPVVLPEFPIVIEDLANATHSRARGLDLIELCGGVGS